MPPGSARVGTDVRACLERDGYAVIEGALKPAECDSIRDELAPQLRRTPTGRNAFEGHRTRRVYGLLAKTRVTDSLAENELVAAVCRDWIGHHQLSAHIAVEVGPGSGAQQLHSDDDIYPVARPHDDLVLSALWAIDALEASSAATVVAPGSQRWTGACDPHVGTVPIEMPIGALLLYRGGLRHGIGENRSQRPRVFVHSEFIASWLRPIETHLLSVSRPLVRQLSSRIQELLGYNVRLPYTGCVDGRHPRKLLRRRGWMGRS